MTVRLRKESGRNVSGHPPGCEARKTSVLRKNKKCSQ